MASGARTVLLSRWRTGGQSSYDLVREFAQELPHTSPADAWQRAVLLAADTRLNLEAEPRVKKAARRRAAQGRPSVLLGRLHAGRFGRRGPPSRGRAPAGRESEAARSPTCKQAVRYRCGKAIPDVAVTVPKGCDDA